MSRTFKLYRSKDISGVSGTGLICEGVLFGDGHAAIHWLGEWPLTTPHPEGLSSIFAIHDHGSQGNLRLVWDDQATGEAVVFTEQDIAFLHDIIAEPDNDSEGNHRRARDLLKRIRVAMGQESPQDSPVRV